MMAYPSVRASPAVNKKVSTPVARNTKSRWRQDGTATLTQTVGATTLAGATMVNTQLRK
jgi:hypothetical protein